MRAHGPYAFLIFLMAGAYAADARAVDYFVSPAGDDSAAGSTAAPWKTLQHAAEAVTAGDTVTVADGTYAGFACSDKSGTGASRIVFKSQTKGGAKINAAGQGADDQDFVQLSSCSYVTVDGFEVSGAPRSGIAILGNKDDGSDAHDVIIQNNHSHDNGGGVVKGRHDGIFSGFALNLTVQDNDVHNNGEHGIYVSNAADNPVIRRNHVHDVGANCIQINADLSTGGDGLISNWLIEANVVYACGSAGFNLDGVIQGVLQNNLAYDCVKGGITLFQGDGAEASHDNLVVNNTIFNPNGSRAALQVADGANNNVVFNNILYSKTGALEIQTVTGLVHDYNFVSSYSGGAASAHESAPDPGALFVDVTGRNLALAAASPALDSGLDTLNQKLAPKVDIEAKPRPQGAGFDRGCYETGNGTGVDAGGTGGSGGSGVDAGRRDAAITGGDSGDTAGSGGSAGSAEAGMTGGSSGSGGASSTGGQAGASVDGGSGAQPTAGANEGGCSCRAAGGRAQNPPSIAFGAALLLAFPMRRRKRARRTL